MITKIYLPDCIVKEDKQQTLIIITYNKYTFLSNNNLYFRWQKDRNTFL